MNSSPQATAPSLQPSAFLETHTKSISAPSTVWNVQGIIRPREKLNVVEIKTSLQHRKRGGGGGMAALEH